MLYQNFASWSGLSKTMLGPFFELQNITNNIVEQLTKETINLGSYNMSTMIKTMQNINKSKKIEDMVKTQLDCMSDMCSKGLNYAQSVAKIYDNGIKDYKTWTDENISNVFKEGKSSSEQQ